MKDKKSFNTYRNIAIIAVCNFLLIISWVIVSTYHDGIFKFDTTKAIDFSDSVQIAIAIITTAIAISAALLAFNSLKSAQRSEEGELYLKMMERYSSTDMVDALRILGKFRQENKNRLRFAIAQWKIDHELNKPYALKLENARHKVKYFYRDLMQMNIANYLSDKLTKQILNPGGRYLFKDLVLAMEPYSNRLQFEGEFGKFTKFHGELERELKLLFTNKEPMKIVCLIPARYDATRFPGKLLSLLDDGVTTKTVIRATYDRINSYKLFDTVAVVTNSIEIKNEIEAHGGNVIYNQTVHNSGSDRIAEAAKDLEADIIVNVQGDEPFVERKPIEDLLRAITDNEGGTREVKVVSLMRPMDNQSHIDSSDYVKVICDNQNFALYFSRSVIPYTKNPTPKAIFYEHVGVYAFTKSVLIKFSMLPPTPLEQIESVECLRYLENGIPIKMVETEHLILEIDTEEDRVNANNLLKKGKLVLG